MPITLDTVVLEYKSLPIVFHEDGRVEVTLRKGYTNASNTFVVIGSQAFIATPEEVAGILDEPSRPGMTRRDDLSLSLYAFCISKGAEIGVVS